ncbi:LysR family transcriptional regulator [Pokkaliibacter sp. CJK22405]|uniref:LysR family transcriptional regulator n=1 Tax=Pokkaliibacter sp. CJK22405 TaxID=3384615 RepID=UPI0039850392
MLRENVADLLLFIIVARSGSFTQAAAQVGLSQSGVSHAIRGLEKRLGLRLLNRSTRRVTPTSEGQRILDRIAPHFNEIEDELTNMVEMRDQPAGTIRITATDYAADRVIWPKLAPVLKQYPDLHVEIVTDYSLTDIIREKFDGGVRLGEQLSEGMIAVKVGPDFRMLVVGSPEYFAQNDKPTTPQDLKDHNCINLRLATHGGLYAWEFEKDERELRVKVQGQFTFNTIYPVVTAALDGYGLGYIPEELVREHIDAGRLVSVLEDWTPPFAGYYFYYPHRRQTSNSFKVIVDALRYRDE